MTLGDRMDLDNAKAREEGREEERWSLLIAQVIDGDITVEKAAKRLDISVEEFQKKMSSI